MLNRIWIPALILLSACAQVKQAKNFSECEFNVGKTSRVVVAGISLDSKKSASDFNFLEIGKLLKALGDKNLPMSANVNVDIQNQGEKMAAINKIEWKAFIEDTEITQGTLVKRIEVSGGKNISVLINVQANIAELLSGDGRGDIMNFMSGMMGGSEKESSIKLKIKPYFKVGNKFVGYPGYINLTKRVN